MKEMNLIIKPDGTIHSLYSDFLSEFEGKKEIKRVSEVEFNANIQKWVVTILHGIYTGCCLPMAFVKREDAINAEIEFFNQELFS